MRLIQDKPCIYLGHSLGGRLALAVTLQSSQPPAQLIVSGCTTPYAARHHHLLRLTRSSMIEVLRESGAIHAAVYSNADLLDFYFPLLRADLYLANQLVFPMETRCSSPVLFLSGEDDCWVEQQDVSDWERLACGHFQQQNFPGDHMFIYQHRESVIRAIQRKFCIL
ncbi:thioesterase II family protein [Pectobacterium parvum]|uniref:thioesterase II family protein n=1 Tax=Pectobacterium parvum TaxID=2778550 RepID=UPI000DD0AC5E|nr:thioesterase II family protein [Pectobacterium parvum]